MNGLGNVFTSSSSFPNKTRHPVNIKGLKTKSYKLYEQLGYLDIHANATLIGTPILLFIHVTTQPANHVTAEQRIKSCTYRSSDSNSDHAMVVGAKRGGLSISEIADLLRLEHTTVTQQI